MDLVAVLASGGLDSAVLLADLARSALVHPVYVRAGLVWEREERAALGRFLDALASPNVSGVVELTAPAMASIDASHWSVTGQDIPTDEAPDEDTFIPGRNILLLSTVAMWCRGRGVRRIAIGSLGGNPFPDATPEFFESFARSLSLGLGHCVTIEAPYRDRTKSALIAENDDLPLGLTLTCANPRNGRHCGRCNKCAERQAAFVAAGVDDPTQYAVGL